MPCRRLRWMLGLFLPLVLFLVGGVRAGGTPPAQESRSGAVHSAPGRPLQPPANVWEVETVDSGTYIGDYTSLALDTEGRPHISYCKEWNCTAVRYAYYDGTAWITTTVDGGGTGAGTSLALDAENRPHISYCRELGYTTELRYAYYDGASWITTTVDNDSYVACDNSLALDAAGRPHIAYGGGLALRYAFYDGATWHIETLAFGEIAGAQISLVMDAYGRPHMSYLSGAPAASLKYAYHDGTTWHFETVSFLGPYYDVTSLALDPAGRPHISFTFGYVVRHAYFDGLDWYIVTVDLGGGSSLALDPAGYSHIAYAHHVDSDTVLLQYAGYDGTNWITETVADTWPLHISLTLDGAGRGHISYYNYSDDGLMYAHQVPCVAAGDVDVAGPATLSAGITGFYSATWTPPSTTLPVTLTWDNGVVSPTAVYSWTTVGTHPLAVTATNVCGQAQGTFTVTVFCQPVAGVSAEGPQSLLAGQEGVYQATAQPITASRPLTYTWDNGAAGPTAVYMWPAPGTYTVSVIATNACGIIRETTLPVEVRPYSVYLPLVWREGQ